MTSIQHEFYEIINKRSAPINSRKNIPLKGKCKEMCSKREINFRSKNHLIHPMETSTPFASMKRSERKPQIDKMIKEYSRPAADKLVSLEDVRPYEVLIISTEHLVGLLDSYQQPNQWQIVYGFVADRFRAIRQDLIVQQLPPQQIIRLLELQIPFYLNGRKRCEDLKIQSYDKKLHHSETDETFSRWFEAVKLGGEFSNEIFKAYIFYYLNKENIAYEIIEIMEFTEDSAELLNIVFAFLCKNYSRFFQEFKNQKVDYIRNALWIHSGLMRFEALQTFRLAFGAKGVTFPLEILADLLAFPSIKSLDECLKLLFHVPNGIPIPFTFFGLSITSLDSSQLSHHWFSV
uniref:SAC3/GANP/THP3 conserved domain-containing protein n=1 Tax=Panagrolaimus sp. PS1159 TaxID=55785 RepID=A0AC35GD84_9BILA